MECIILFQIKSVPRDALCVERKRIHDSKEARKVIFGMVQVDTFVLRRYKCNGVVGRVTIWNSRTSWVPSSNSIDFEVSDHRYDKW